MIKIRHENLLVTFVTLSLITAVFLVINTQLADAEPVYPNFEFKWVDDDGDIWNDNDSDGVIPYVPSIEQVPLIIQFQIVNKTGFYFGEMNQQEAMENITLTGNALFTGTLDKIPRVSFIDNKNWSVPVIPTMNQGGGDINITANARGEIITENLNIGGSNYVKNGTIVTVNPNKFEFGTNQTFTVDVKYADGSVCVSAAVYLHYIGDDDGGTPGDPIEGHTISSDTNGFDGYTLGFNITQQTVDQIIAGFSSIRERRNLTVYAMARLGGTQVYGYAKIEMMPQVPKPELEVEIKRGIDRKVTVFIRNNGEANATNVKYNIAVKGGIFNFINKSVEGFIPLLEMDNETRIDVSVFGLGFLYINANVDTISEEVIGLVFLHFVYIPYLL